MIPLPTPDDLTRDAEDDFEYAVLCQPRNDGESLVKIASAYIRRAAAAEAEVADLRDYKLSVCAYTEQAKIERRSEESLIAELRFQMAKEEKWRRFTQTTSDT